MEPTLTDSVLLSLGDSAGLSKFQMQQITRVLISTCTNYGSNFGNTVLILLSSVDSNGFKIHNLAIAAYPENSREALLPIFHSLENSKISWPFVKQHINRDFTGDVSFECFIWCITDFSQLKNDLSSKLIKAFKFDNFEKGTKNFTKNRYIGKMIVFTLWCVQQKCVLLGHSVMLKLYDTHYHMHGSKWMQN